MNKNKTSKVFLLTILSIFTLLFVHSVSATTTLVNPIATNASQVSNGGNIVFNITTTDVMNVSNLANFSVYAKSSLTSNTTWTLLGINNSVNLATMANRTTIIININQSIVEDANDYIFNVTVVANNSVTSLLVTNGTTSSGFTIDNTIPQAPTLTSGTNSDVTVSGAKTISFSVVDVNTTTCTYTIQRGGTSTGDGLSSGTGTYATNTCSFSKTFSSSVDNGLWYFLATASDGTNTTAGTLGTVSVAIAGTGGGSSGSGSGSSGSGSSGSNGFVILVFAGLIILALYYAFK